jgi:hypothetical protein
LPSNPAAPNLDALFIYFGLRDLRAQGRMLSAVEKPKMLREK